MKHKSNQSDHAYDIRSNQSKALVQSLVR